MNQIPAQFEDIKLLEDKLLSVSLPPQLLAKAKANLERLVRLASAKGYGEEYDSNARLIDWIINLPWNKTSQDNLSLDSAKKVLDSNHFGLENIKERIMEFMSIESLKKNKGEKFHAPAFLLLGLVGTGKTTMAYSIAEALGRKFGRIPLGGMGDALQLRGRARAYPDAEPGQIMKVLRRVGTKNPVILLDEVDRITNEAKADIMGVLVELLDPEQNSAFLDHFIDYPFDLSEVIFITTANNTTGIATAVLDRLEVIELPSYSDEQKITIGKNYLMPKAIVHSGLDRDDLTVEDSVWQQIVRPLGFDAGMRTLDRTIKGICAKIAKQKIQGNFQKVRLNNANYKQYLPTY
ncbi:MAG: Lon protease 2 [Candidatus Curtissbacteria bacterium GW2011_GWA1_40_9]|uniref:Lon protease 2 n=1 Tax=Candidatus Curtissbacteria bacterium GW2011_GWA1_40_9 TaxID=1618408 RepID=A0A0G0TLV2_9BACT|nr:MAG: Lon protease 2 [Candidatus Curtissbacteria bacterium GW2011_GWA1_40_9]